MKLYSLQSLLRLPIPIQEAWNFFSDPRNLAEITPAEMRFTIISPLPARMYEGLLITYTIRPLLSVPLQWVTEITHLNEPSYFVDEQRIGPYRFWHHQHHFRSIPGGVEVEDLVHYSLPFGPAGLIAHWLLVGRQLQTIFSFRGDSLTRKFGRLPENQ